MGNFQTLEFTYSLSDLPFLIPLVSPLNPKMKSRIPASQTTNLPHLKLVHLDKIHHEQSVQI